MTSILVVAGLALVLGTVPREGKLQRICRRINQLFCHHENVWHHDEDGRRLALLCLKCWRETTGWDVAGTPMERR